MNLEIEIHVKEILAPVYWWNLIAMKVVWILIKLREVDDEYSVNLDTDFREMFQVVCKKIFSVI
jgi:hypothetical protein